MRRFRVPALALSVAASFALGCAAPDSGPSETLGASKSEIINGSLDTADNAVVAVMWFNNPDPNKSTELTECSGTIIATNGNTGFVLTAGHCCDPAEPPQWVVMGDDYYQGTYYPVTDYLKNPNYTIGGAADQQDDFCMLQFPGPSNMQVIPAATTINYLAKGTMVKAVGYGKTSGANNNNNTKRNEIVVAIDSYYSATQVLYNEQNGGTCEGDSGGPDIYDDGSGPIVFGVHSFVSGNCDMYSASGMPGAVSSFIQSYISGTPVAPTCDECITTADNTGGACAAAVATCEGDTACSALDQCIGNCASGDQTCANTCTSQSTQTAVNELNALFDCWCNTACVSECMCASSGTTTTGTGTNTSTGALTSVGTGTAANGTGTGSAGTTGAGGNQGAGSGAGGSGDQSGKTASTGGCAVASDSTQSMGGALGLALAALAFVRRRRQA